MTVGIDADNKGAVIEVEGGQRVLVPVGEFSPWLPVTFDPGAIAGNVVGIVRFFVKRLSPSPFIYASPVNLDPMNPYLPLSAPEPYVEQLAKAVGRFYTQGMAEDTHALRAGVLSDEEFLAQSEIVFEERQKLLNHALNTYNGGLLFFYFSSIDLTSHMFFRTLREDATPQDAAHANVIPDLYTQMDGIIGQVEKNSVPIPRWLSCLTTGSRTTGGGSISTRGC